jgi:plasmid stabilization system protein ParE
MPQVRLSARAQSDIARLHSFLLSKNLKAPQRATQAIRGSFASLAKTPLLGRSIDDAGDLRELVIDFGASGCLALYRVDRALDVVIVLAIKHQSEDGYR